MQGLVNSNYAGVNGVLVNPSSFTDSKLYLDINLATAGVFFNNNYLYVAKNDYYLWYLFNNPIIFPKHDGNKVLYDQYTGTYKNGYANIRIMGPSAMVNYGRHAFGFQESYRIAASVKDVPFHVAKLMFDGTGYKPQQGNEYHADPFRFAAMSWAEVGLTYSYVLTTTKMTHLSVGATLKRVMATQGAYITNHSLDYMIPNNDSLIVRNINAEVGYGMYGDKLFKGRGWGADFGFTYKLKPNGNPPMTSFRKMCQQTYNDYSLKVGVSLLDFGIIRFNKNSEVHEYKASTTNTFTGMEEVRIRNINQFRNELDYRFFGDTDPEISKVKDKFSISLPTALSIQTDIKLKRYWYFNTSFFYGLQSSRTYIRRSTQLSFCPRYERRYFEVNMPVSLYELKYPRVGFSIRLGSITVGTDKLAGLFDYSDFYGLDIYASVKLSFGKGNCNRRNWARYIANRTKIFKCRHF